MPTSEIQQLSIQSVINKNVILRLNLSRMLPGQKTLYCPVKAYNDKLIATSAAGYNI